MPDLSSTELNLSQIHEFFSKNRSFLKDVRDLFVSGGEPFLRKDIGDVLRIIHEILPRARIMIATNGFDTERIVGVMNEILEDVTIHAIAVPLDGLSKTHNALRGVNGAFERVIRTVNALSELRKNHNFKLLISFTIAPSNYTELLDVFTLSQELNTLFICRSVHSSFFYRNVGDSYQFKPKAIGEIREMLSEIANTCRKNYMSTLEWRFACFYLSKIISYLNHPSKLVMPCFSGAYSLIIDPYGFVYPCLLMNDQLGDVKRSPLKEILSSREARAIRKKIEKGSCPNCWMDCYSFMNIKLDLVQFSKWTLESILKERMHAGRGAFGRAY